MKTAVVLIRELHQFNMINTCCLGLLSQYEQVIFLIEIDSFDNLPKAEIDGSMVANKIYFLKWVVIDLLQNRGLVNAFNNICVNINKSSGEFVLLSFYYSSDPVLLLLFNVNFKAFYLLDEGGATVDVAFQRSKFQFKNNLKICLKSALHLKWLDLPSKVNFITRFNFLVEGADKVFNVQTEKLLLEIERDEDQVWVLGTSAIKLKIVCKKYYLKVLKRLVEIHESKQCWYLPHRKESPLEIYEIEKIGFSILTSSQPIEIMYKSLVKQPSVIYSLVTSCALYELWFRFKALTSIKYIGVPTKSYFHNYELYKNLALAYSVSGEIEILEF